MATKLISCSFEPGSMGGFITICNGVNFGRAEHFSKTLAVTKEAFIAACKDRVLFNDILGIDIRTGWQNALAAAIEPFKAMKEDFDADTAAKVSSELDVQMRGEDAVNADIAAVEKENAKLEKAAKRAAKAKAKKDEKPAEPEVPAEPETPAEPEHDTTVTEDELAPSAEPVAETETPEVQAEMEKVAEEVVAAEQGQPVPQPEEPVAEEPKTEEVNDGQDRVADADNSGEDTRGQEDSGVSSERPGSESAQ